MAYLTGKTKGGKDWTPNFIEAIDAEKCIGCGRCYKACSRNVFAPEDFEDEETESLRMIMTIANDQNCIGCVACGVACSKKAFSFKPLAI
ncbi:ferredoxin III, nif-specific [Geoalkalibacter ferrihydriticus]|uniref:Ferredoxin n=2 Tax=Geoalkalibacter ferrihydriticus TaxID=392333 RepID=A0A0C2HGP0_9BACT|nr:ferredoxin III, nif-specific [Geoalkalibacter ferrihydriticus]KIH76116.1 ferredoxin [Geoalkalibacter ferrihydriticus DSM 17813]SDM44594.1 ferredoxin III, nif-specific [Geoalkalibacter ferrihydriticus]